MRLFVSFVLVICLGFGFAEPALAHDGSDGVGVTAAQAEQRARALVDSYKQKAQQKVKDAKENTHEKSAELRQKACIAKKNSIQKRLSLRVTLAEKHKAVFDKIFQKVQNYYNEKGLNTDNYDTLVEQVEDAQASTNEKILALKSTNVTIDCTSPSVTSTLSTFKEALVATRDSLKTYRSSLLELIQAVHKSAQENGS